MDTQAIFLLQFVLNDEMCRIYFLSARTID